MKLNFILFIMIVSLTFFNSCKTKKQDITFETTFQKQLNSTDFKKSKLQVTNLNGKIKYDIITLDDDIFLGIKRVCAGNGYSFARCVQKALKTHNCLTIKVSGDDYTADTCE